MAGNPFTGVLKQTGKALADFLFPPVCLVCESDTDTAPLCKECLAALQPLEDALTIKDLRIRAWARFTHPLDKVIYAFKYNHRRGLARFLASGLADVLNTEPDFSKADALVPIPLHLLKRWIRTYNQSELIARALSENIGIPEVNLLRRRRVTRTQTRLSDDERMRNVAGAFRVSRRDYGIVKDRSFILVDDVVTTGSTLVSAARTLMDAGAERVFGLAVGGAWKNR